MGKNDILNVAHNGEILEVIRLEAIDPTLKDLATFFIQEIKSVFNLRFKLNGIKSRFPKRMIPKNSVNAAYYYLVNKYGIPHPELERYLKSCENKKTS